MTDVEIFVEPRPPMRQGPDAAVIFAMDDITVVTSAITVATLRTLARTLMTVIRRRGAQQPERDAVTLIVKGPDIDLEVRLSADVRAGEILECLMPLLAEPRR